jgi:hypothetical protein
MKWMCAWDPCGDIGHFRHLSGSRAVERAEHGRFGEPGGVRVVERILQGGHPESIREEDELLPVGAAHLAGGGQELDGWHPFRITRLRLAHECVLMPDQRGHDLFETGIRRALHGGDDGFRQVFFRQLPHFPSFLPG